MPEEAVPNYQPFPLTPWSLVGRASGPEHETRRKSLNELLKQYLPALRTHLIHGKRMSPEKAEDLLQSFMADKIVEEGLVGKADRAQGKFRTFLLTSLGRFNVSQIRKAKSKKRAPSEGIVAFEEFSEPVESNSPSLSFEVAWARQVVAEATRLTQSECDASGRNDVWQLLKGRILDPALHGVEPLSYNQLSERVPVKSPLQVSNLLVTGRRMYARNLRAVVAEYARNDSEIDQEIQDLRSILANSDL